MDLRWGMRNKLMGFGVLLHPKAPLMASVLEGPGLPDGGGVKGAGGGVGGVKGAAHASYLGYQRGRWSGGRWRRVESLIKGSIPGEKLLSSEGLIWIRPTGNDLGAASRSRS